MKNILLKQKNMISETICDKSQLWSIYNAQSTSSFIGSYYNMFTGFIGMLSSLKNEVLMYLIHCRKPVPIPVRINSRK